MVPLCTSVALQPLLAVGNIGVAVVVDLLAEVAVLTFLVGICAGVAQVEKAIGLLPLRPLGVIGHTNEGADLVATAAEGLLGGKIDEGHARSNARWHHELNQHILGCWRMMVVVLGPCHRFRRAGERAVGVALFLAGLTVEVEVRVGYGAFLRVAVLASQEVLVAYFVDCPEKH